MRTSVNFDPRGNVVFVGTTTGQVKALDAETLVDIATFEASEQAILMIRVRSLIGNMMTQCL